MAPSPFLSWGPRGPKQRRLLTTRGQGFLSQLRTGAGNSRRFLAGPGVPALPENSPGTAAHIRQRGAGLGVLRGGVQGK